MIEEKGRICFDVPISISVICGVARGWANALQKIFLPKKISFFWLLRRRGANKKNTG
jgi:hypothetical protein